MGPPEGEGDLATRTSGDCASDEDIADLFRREGWWSDVTVAARVEELAELRPRSQAITTSSSGIDWATYAAASDALASALRSTGAERGDRVGVLLPDGPTIHVAYVACEKAGLVAVGLGMRAGQRELEFILGKTGPRALVTLDSYRDQTSGELFEKLKPATALVHHVVVPRFEDQPTGAVLVDGAVAPGPSDSPVAPSEALGPDEVSIVNSTSGTTGMPKCVMHTQNRHYYINEMARELGALSSEDVFMSLVPTPFGFGLWTSHFTPAFLGARLVTLERFDPDLALELVEREGVTVLAGVSTQLRMLLASERFTSQDLSSLRVMFTGGEAVPMADAAAFEGRTGAKVLQFYGSNESGVVVGTRLTDPDDKRLGTAGSRLAGTQLRLLDGDEDVTESGRGQPASWGPALCRGYYDDAEANAQLFTDDGYVRHADICTVDADGYLSVVGRTAEIIIRGGKNISAAQVEAEVGAHPAVALVAVVGVPDDVFGERVCACVQLDADLTLDELCTFLEARGVSREIWPERLEVFDQLPISSGGKVAKGAIRAQLPSLSAAGKTGGTGS